jgi:GR25 family glycosyltransferase involved in LPS biosynthesis
MGQVQQQKRQTVLIVEDDAYLRRLTAALLETNNWTLSSVKARKLRLQPVDGDRQGLP